MNSVACMAPKLREELFQESASRIGLSAAIIEKDFWVCWSLARLFEIPDIKDYLIFKGGTSLSKVYKVIERFSEDVDVSISRELFGFSDGNDPVNAANRSQQRKKVEQLNKKCEELVNGEIITNLREAFGVILGEEGTEWNVHIAEDESKTVLFEFPRNVSPNFSTSYVKPFVRIEFGGRSDDWPSSLCTIRSYAAEVFPQVFPQAECTVRTLDIERTFWEKATLLHAEYHRPTGTIKEHMSRHYYDLACLADHEAGLRALKRIDILEHVVQYKKVFFSSAWAQYDTAKPGSFNLVPKSPQLDSIRRDYQRMREMFFGTLIGFTDVMQRLKQLEDQINNC